MAALRKRWVLVVDDDAAVRGALVDLIGAEDGLAAVGAASGDEALRVLGTLRVHTLLLDLLMPGMDGLELIERLRSIDGAAETPIVVVTALPPEAPPRRAVAAVAQVVPKPFDPDELLAAIRRVIDRRSGTDRRSGQDRRG